MQSNTSISARKMTSKKDSIEALRKRLKTFRPKTELANDLIQIATGVMDTIDVNESFDPSDILDSVREAFPPVSMIFTNEFFKLPLFAVKFLHDTLKAYGIPQLSETIIGVIRLSQSKPITRI